MPMLAVGLLVSALAISGGSASLDDLPLREMNGSEFRVTAFRGRVVVLDAWATWCAPCLAELPVLKRLTATYPDDVVVIGINFDRFARRDLAGWLSRHNITWKQHFDGRGFTSPIARRLGIESIPASVILGRDGRIVATNLRGEALEAAVRSLVSRERQR